MKRLIRLAFIGFILASPLLAGLFRVHVNRSVVLLGYELSEAEEKRDDLTKTIQKLEVELSSESSPERLMNMARELKLSSPTANQVVGADWASGVEP